MYLSWLRRYNLLIFDEVDSTNSEAVRLAQAGVNGDFVIWAQSQTAGRGRNSKKWFSEPRNFYVSLLLDRDFQLATKPQLSFVTALAIYEVIEHISASYDISLKLSLKWPNDLLISGQKISGILLESINISKKNYTIIGVGINLNSHPTNIEQVATSLTSLGINVESEEVLNLFISFIEKYISLWRNEGFLSIRKLWLERAHKLNETITISDGNKKISGQFCDIDSMGNICIKLKDGQMHKSLSCEILSS
jgi:BirA family transcriptional regulator, biotin operon repressor / biotin---[acetyl-CoA-carboxylase] ligase